MSARHEGCARACLQGLGERSKSMGREMHYIHVSEFQLSFPFELGKADEV